MMTRLRSSTDGMGCPLVVKQRGAARGFVGLRADADKARRLAQAERGGLDHASAAPMFGLARACGEREGALVRRQSPDVGGDEPIAEIALRIAVVGGRPTDCGVA